MNKNIFYGLFLLALLPMLASAYCSKDTATSTNGTDYFFIQTNELNYTGMEVWQTWDSWDFFTPRLNFTRPVNETMPCSNTGNYTIPDWSTYTVVNTSVEIKNASGTVVGAGNYTVEYTSLTAGDWRFLWNTETFKGQTGCTLYFNRTFVKNVDDLVATPSDVFNGSTEAYWLVENTPVNAGDWKSFRFRNDDTSTLGLFVNSSNWALGWNYYDSTCSTSACTGVNNVIVGVLITVFLVGILAFVGFMAYSGNMSAQAIVGVVIAVVIMLIAVAILNGLLTDLCLG